ncbi:MAG: hypothetical protein M3301_04595, partial [Chloroflexota bacterium]|nr:hypothetical protein [Chloroflexota bacterium]
LVEASERGARDPFLLPVPSGSTDPSDATPHVTPEREGEERSGRARRTTPPAERRRAALAVVAAWRARARDLAVATQGGKGEIREIDLLEEIQARAADLQPAELAAFLDRLDQMANAIEAYANPELALDVLLLRWPRAHPGRDAA